MGGIAAKVRALAFALGAPGLFLVAFLDSSFLSLPEIADILVIWMVAQHKTRLALYVISATAGSVSGCLVMYYIGRKGGGALIRKRFATATVERVMATLQRHGVMAVLVPAILPPPAPFKVFVLLAGASGISVGRFVSAVAIGRGLRYLALGILAVEYGDRATAYLAENGRMVALVMGLLLVAAFGAYLLWSKTRRAARP
jgi:membrane protein YqaA with SNARE-associated domain